MTRSGRSESMRSKSGSTSAPTRGRDFTSGGKGVVARDTNHRVAGADGEQHLRHRGDGEMMRVGL